MRPISRLVPRKDHGEKATGSALYAADLPREGVLAVAFVRAKQANAPILSVRYPPMPEGYSAVDGRDLPRNEAKVHADELDMPVFASARTGYVGEAIALIAGPTLQEAERLASETTVLYGEAGPILRAIDGADTFFYDYPLAKGDVAGAFEAADDTYAETFYTGLQEQAYLEPQAMEARVEDGVLTILGSMQCPYYIVSALEHAFSRAKEQVRVIQTTTGGGFGGKEEYPSLLACQVGAAALKTGKPCRAVYARREDIAVTTKRHPARIAYRAAIREGRVTALDVDIVLDGGAYRGLSAVVLQRSMFCSSGVYNIEHLRVRGRVAMTHTPPNGAFRGFGAPQSFFALEMFMNHIAQRLGVDPVAFKRRHFVRQGDRTATNGIYHEAVPLPAMLGRALSLSDFAAKRAAYAAPQAGRHLRGIGLSLAFHGCGFTGNGERDIIRAKVRLIKSEAGEVTILGSNTEIGQGLRTTFPKIVAETLGIPLAHVRYALPDTRSAPDSGPTVASRSIMIVGRLLQRAASRLKEIWREGEEQVAEADYVDPPHRLPFDMATFTGDAYPAYSWAVNVLEVSVDRLTAETKILGCWAVFDCGTPIDLTVLRGQAEGGILQGLGYALMEYMDTDAGGAVRQNSLTDYILPTAMDAPPIQVEFYDDPYVEGPFGARGAGELTLVGAAPAFAAAVEQAISSELNRLPLRPEALLAQIRDGKNF